MSIENPFNTEKENATENTSEKNNGPILVTPLEEYLEMIKNVHLKEVSEEEYQKEQAIIEKKMDSYFENKINEQLLNELSENGLIEIIGDYPSEDPMAGDVFRSHFDNSHVAKYITLTNEENEPVSRRYYREKMAGLTDEETIIKTEIAETYNTLSDNGLFYKAIERSKQLDEKVRAGEMVYLGEMTIQQYIDVLKKGLLPRSVDSANVIEKVPMFNGGENYLPLVEKFYGRIK